jgi:hypothetical protein
MPTPPRAVPRCIKEWFDELNHAHFEALLTMPKILIVDPRRDEAGLYSHVPGVATLLMLTTECLANGDAFAKDSLLHEMIHHALATLDGVDDQAHGDRFTARANAIAIQLGLGRVDPYTKAALCWPQTLRGGAA